MPQYQPPRVRQNVVLCLHAERFAAEVERVHSDDSIDVLATSKHKAIEGHDVHFRVVRVKALPDGFDAKEHHASPFWSTRAQLAEIDAAAAKAAEPPQSPKA